MARMQRLLGNLFGGWFQLRRRFPAALLDEMAAAIAAGERHHLGEIRFAVESRLAPLAVLDGLDATDPRAAGICPVAGVGYRAQQRRAVLRVDGRAPHRDRRRSRHRAGVPASEWEAICARMRDCYARGQWREGSLQASPPRNALLQRHFPAGGTANPDELSDRPVLL